LTAGQPPADIIGKTSSPPGDGKAIQYAAVFSRIHPETIKKNRMRRERRLIANEWERKISSRTASPVSSSRALRSESLPACFRFSEICRRVSRAQLPPMIDPSHRSYPRVEPEGMLRRIMRQGIPPNPALFATADLYAAGLAFQAACTICSFEASPFFSLEASSLFGFATGAA
jgi:hypothetical protein